MKKKLLAYNMMQFPEKIQFFNEGIQREVDATGDSLLPDTGLPGRSRPGPKTPG